MTRQRDAVDDSLASVLKKLIRWPTEYVKPFAQLSELWAGTLSEDALHPGAVLRLFGKSRERGNGRLRQMGCSVRARTAEFDESNAVRTTEDVSGNIDAVVLARASAVQRCRSKKREAC